MDATRLRRSDSVCLSYPDLLSDANTSSIAIAPDGTQLVYLAQQGEASALPARNRGLKAQPIEGTENGEFPFFSPDGQWLGFHADGKLKKISLTGGPPLPLCDIQKYAGASWGPDDTILFHWETSGMGIWRISSIGGPPELLISPRLEEGEWDIAYPELLPGGKEVVFSTLDGSCRHASSGGAVSRNRRAKNSHRGWESRSLCPQRPPALCRSGFHPGRAF